MPYFWDDMSPFLRQSDRSHKICQYLLAFLVILPLGTIQAGEAAVDPTGNGIDILQDSTVDMDSRSSETSAAAEELIVPGPTREYAGPLANAVDDAIGKAEPLQILGAEIAPGSSQRLSWSATELFEGVPVSTPVLVLNGVAPGPTLCLTAAVHGDELNGIEMVRRVFHDIEPSNSSVFPSSMSKGFDAVHDTFRTVAT
jgi:hypothetical protein